ncbi:MAG: Fic family protein [Acidobacteria bacterium]|nr:Fic family protein [Acidobacteriota bacterium]
MSLLRADIDTLLDKIEVQRTVIDARLDKPAYWRGRLRHGGPDHDAKVPLVACAFDGLVNRARRGDLGPLTPDQFLDLHRTCTGGGEYRTTGARIGEHRIPYRPQRLPGLVQRALARASDGVEPPPLAAARLHLELLLVHPFSDGNGRTVRLATSWILLRAGYRSTLLTSVEQHVRGNRRAYARYFQMLTLAGLDTQGPWLRMALNMMAEAAVHASAFRTREDSMRAALAGRTFDQQSQLLVANDFKGKTAPELEAFARWSEPSPVARAQIKRLLAEERDSR